MNAYQAITRTIIMLGTVVVGVMAWQVYGPPPERLAPIVDRAMELADQTLSRDEAQPRAQVIPPPPPPLSAIDNSTALPLPEGTSLRIDPEVAPTTHTQELIAADTSPQENVVELLERLRSLGGVDVEMKPWGANGQAYRCQCRAATVENPALERHFDAIATDPRAAIEEIVAEVERWRNRATH